MTLKTPHLAILATTLLLPASLPAQPSPELQRAVQLLQSGDYDQAATLLDKVVEASPEHAGAWYRLAQARRGLEQWSEVDKALDQAEKHGFQLPLLLTVMRAEVDAAGGDTKGAFRRLEKVAEAGPNRTLLATVEGADALAPLHSDPRWAEITKQLTPCASDGYREFDFWIGDFRVENPAGVQVGENRITRELHGCALVEHWANNSGGLGMSVNSYDPSDGNWTQHYRDSNGLPSNWPVLKGKLEKPGVMVLHTPEGESRSRWTWTRIDANKVRQMAESTSDGGKTWQVTWDSYYIRKEPVAGGD